MDKGGYLDHRADVLKGEIKDILKLKGYKFETKLRMIGKLVGHDIPVKKRQSEAK